MYKYCSKSTYYNLYVFFFFSSLYVSLFYEYIYFCNDDD